MSEELFEKYLRGELSPEESVRLKELLEDPAEARRFVDFLQEWTALAEVSRRLEGVLAPARKSRSARRRAAGTPHPPARLAWVAACVAAAVLVGIVAALVGRPSAPPETPPADVVRQPSAPPVAQAEPVRLPPQEPPAPVPPSPAPAEAVPRPVAVPEAPKPPAPEPPPAAVPSEPAPKPRPAAPPEPAPTISVVAILEQVQGDVTLGSREAARPGTVLAAGRSLRLGPGASRAVVVFPDGTRLEAGPDTVLERLESGTVHMTRGTLRASVARP